MGDTKAKFTDTRTGFIDILMCRYEDEHLALWMKIVFCFIWIVSIPNGLIYGVDTDYIMALFSIILMLLLNIAVSRKNYRTWVDVAAFIIIAIPVFFVYYHACIGYFSVFFPLFFSSVAVFILGIRNSFFINIICSVIILICSRTYGKMSVRHIYGDNVTLRFPYIYVCIILISYCLMYAIQKYWVDKRRRKQILQIRIEEENKHLHAMSMRIMDTMTNALDAKISGEKEHCVRVAGYCRQIAQMKKLDEKMCEYAYSAGLLHEIGMVGIPDRLIRKDSLTDDEYTVYQTYVTKGYEILSTLQVEDTINVAQAVKYHRECFDGTGFVEGLKGNEIPVIARILSVADYADRHVMRGETPEKIISDIKYMEGTRFEPGISLYISKVLME